MDIFSQIARNQNRVALVKVKNDFSSPACFVC